MKNKHFLHKKQLSTCNDQVGKDDQTFIQNIKSLHKREKMSIENKKTHWTFFFSKNIKIELKSCSQNSLYTCKVCTIVIAAPCRISLDISFHLNILKDWKTFFIVIYHQCRWVLGTLVTKSVHHTANTSLKEAYQNNFFKISSKYGLS